MDKAAPAKPSKNGCDLDFRRKPVFDVLGLAQKGLRIGKIPVQLFGDPDDGVRRIGAGERLLLAAQSFLGAHRAISWSASAPKRSR